MRYEANWTATNLDGATICSFAHLQEQTRYYSPLEASFPASLHKKLVCTS
jgi:hypothetical protein